MVTVVLWPGAIGRTATEVNHWVGAFRSRAAISVEPVQLAAPWFLIVAVKVNTVWPFTHLPHELSPNEVITRAGSLGGGGGPARDAEVAHRDAKAREADAHRIESRFIAVSLSHGRKPEPEGQPIRAPTPPSRGIIGPSGAMGKRGAPSAAPRSARSSCAAAGCGARGHSRRAGRWRAAWSCAP